MKSVRSTAVDHFLLPPRLAQSVALAACFLCTASSVYAQADISLSSPSLYIQISKMPGDGQAFQVGTTWPWKQWERIWGDAHLQLHGDMALAHWKADHQPASLVMLFIPSWRLYLSSQSKWFADAGIGLSYSNRRFTTDDHKFSTHWNFASHIGVGRHFGHANQHEWSLRLGHVSNASIRSPNPGADFLQLRYAHRF